MPTPSLPTGPQAVDSVVDVTLSSFKTDVVEASKKALVLISFWASWEASGKQINATLEKMARTTGAFKLAKIDVDKNRPVVQQMGVQEIPAVYAIHKGRPIDAFSGALPEAQIKAWIDRLLKATGTESEEKTAQENALKKAQDLLAAGESASAAALYSTILENLPDNAAAWAGLAACAMKEGHIEKARQVLESVPPEIVKDTVFDSVRTSLELADQAKDAPQTEELEQRLAKNPLDHAARFDLALATYAQGRREEAVDHLLEIVRRDRKWNDDGARKQLVKFLEAFGADDPLTLSTRRRLSSLLFS